MKLLIVQLPPFSCYFIPIRNGQDSKTFRKGKYSPGETVTELTVWTATSIQPAEIFDASMTVRVETETLRIDPKATKPSQSHISGSHGGKYDSSSLLGYCTL
jgi:hypothetical protein